MDTQDLLKKLTKEQLKGLSREELIHLLMGEQELREQLEQQRDQTQEEKLLLEEKYVLIKSKIFGRSSEKSQKESGGKKLQKNNKKRENYSKNLSERYPNVDVREDDIELETAPTCSCCQKPMCDSGMTEDSEYLTVIPKKFLIVRQKRHKYRCSSCHGELQTSPGVPRIIPGSAYGDEVILDVALSKFCDLIPVERYAMMAGRQGLKSLPPNSLINLTHELADFVRPAYAKLAEEIKNSRVVQADETPHRMLEGHEKRKWYLWSFSSSRSCYFEFHETRSGDVAHNFLRDSSCQVLLSDVYSGYIRAIELSNDYRRQKNLPQIVATYCNAHARRKFDEAVTPFGEMAQYYLDKYQEIYALNSESKRKTSSEILDIRSKMLSIFNGMKEQGVQDLKGISNKSSLAMAINYLTNNFEGLTYFIKDPDVLIDNNSQERLLRSPVIGRKTWYGTHSIKGAKTAAVLFALVESCKMNQINPREYFKDLVQMLHQKKSAQTPWEYHQLKVP